MRMINKLKSKVITLLGGYESHVYEKEVRKMTATLSILKALSRGNNKCVEFIENNEDLKDVDFNKTSVQAVVLAGDGICLENTYFEITEDFTCFGILGDHCAVSNVSVQGGEVHTLLREIDYLRKYNQQLLTKLQELGYED